MTRIAVTLTTINKPTVLEDFLRLQQCHGTGGAEVDYIVVGDRKTPSGVEDFVRSLNGRTASRFVYLDLAKQKSLFGHLTKLWEHIPVDSFARRNYGDLLAYKEGYDIIVRIDDDNYPVDGNYFREHSIVGRALTVTTVTADNGWYNVCETLRERENIPFYPRGYVYAERWKPTTVKTARKKVKVAINAGLSIGDPDVDAITRLYKPIDAIAFDESRYGSSFALATGTWAPINTQNTAFARETIPAAFISPHAGRYDDILSGYFLRRIVDRMGEAVCYGVPILNQVRNQHNLWKDLDLERVSALTVLGVTQILRETNLVGTSYATCFAELIAAARRQIDFETSFYEKILEGMKIWAEMFAKDCL